jgi:hypothetical protein
VDVLEAVHLLLAVRLFVVVVAVDPRWLLRSLTSHYQDLFAATGPSQPDHSPLATALNVNLGEEELWASSPAQYLEKIFQIVLTLPPLEPAGYRRMLDQLVGVQATGTGTGNSSSDYLPQPNVPEAVVDREAVVGEKITTTFGAGTTPDPTPEARPTSWSLASLPVIERVDPLTLTPNERTMLNLLGPPLITSPRAVKRLANSYGLLAALSSDDTGHRHHLEPVPDPKAGRDGYPYRATIVLLGAVIGYPMMGPSLFPHLHHTALAQPGTPWPQYLDSLRPTQTDTDAWTSPMEVKLSAARAQHIHNLISHLSEVGQRAEQAGLPLPDRLAIWAAWVVPVGRLSFPTGPAVSRLAQPEHSSDAKAAPAPPEWS